MTGVTGKGESAEPAGDAETVRAAFDAMPTVMNAMEGPQHRFVAANRAWRNFVNRPFLDRPAREALPDLAGQRLFELVEEVYTTGEALTAREQRIQLHGDGAVQADVFLDFTLTPWFWDDGRPRGVLVTQADVTERVRQRQAEQQRTAEAERRYEAARDVVVQLQEALLPTALPVLPTAAVSARYLVAAAEQAAGGDWFSAVPLPGGNLALVLGDIVGHGVAASAAMGQLRAVLDELLRESGDLESALEWADRMAARSPTMRAATVCVAVLDPTTGSLRYATCGHPAPLIVGSDGATRYLESSGGGPLGTGSRLPVRTDTLEVGEVVLLYSDGLIERRGRPQDVQLAALAEIAGDAVTNRVMTANAPGSATERVCQLSVELLTRQGYDDDVTVLAAQRRPRAVSPLRRELRADPAAFAQLRTAANNWMQELEPEVHDYRAVELVVTELVANAVEHAYPPAVGGQVRVHAELGADGVLQLEVADDGTWEEPGSEPAQVSGRGLWMVGAVVDELHVEHGQRRPGGRTGEYSPTGTRVIVRLRLSRPAALAPVPARTPERRMGMDFRMSLRKGTPRVLQVSGPLDIITAPEFADQLTTASRGGVHPLVIDLTDVDVLASAGVSALFAARDEHAVHGHQLAIVAKRDSVPAQVLKLVGLEHATELPS